KGEGNQAIEIPWNIKTNVWEEVRETSKTVSTLDYFVLFFTYFESVSGHKKKGGRHSYLVNIHFNL
ncbi:hypothetical protein HAX54_002786, partial [Datura stramonium]|nr:hypothetical protein [Datura stramonium]